LGHAEAVRAHPAVHGMQECLMMHAAGDVAELPSHACWSAWTGLPCWRVRHCIQCWHACIVRAAGVLCTVHSIGH
jgi:hypothetical protein